MAATYQAPTRTQAPTPNLGTTISGIALLPRSHQTSSTRSTDGLPYVLLVELAWWFGGVAQALTGSARRTVAACTRHVPGRLRSPVEARSTPGRRRVPVRCRRALVPGEGTGRWRVRARRLRVRTRPRSQAVHGARHAQTHEPGEWVGPNQPLTHEPGDCRAPNQPPDPRARRPHGAHTTPDLPPQLPARDQGRPAAPTHRPSSPHGPERPTGVGRRGRTWCRGRPVRPFGGGWCSGGRGGRIGRRR
jgi:hypothetical protein